MKKLCRAILVNRPVYSVRIYIPTQFCKTNAAQVFLISRTGRGRKRARGSHKLKTSELRPLDTHSMHLHSQVHSPGEGDSDGGTHKIIHICFIIHIILLYHGGWFITGRKNRFIALTLCSLANSPHHLYIGRNIVLFAMYRCC